MAQIDQWQMLPMGTMLDERYRIVRYLASGGFGSTYVAEDIHLGEQVAVKEFFMRGINHRSPDGTTVEVSNDTNVPVFDGQLKKFRREAQRIYNLRNSHIIHVIDLFDANGTSYYVMELIDGMSLADQVRLRPLTEGETRDVALQVLDALETMHAAGLYHLDVKPANIMRDKRGHCTLIDFGASKQLTTDERSTLSSSTMSYTPGYAPMEQVAQQSKNIGPWTDFYALGATLYRLVTGDPPPEVSIDDFAPDGRQFSYSTPVSPSLRHAISTLMNPIHSMRPKNAAAVRALLEGNVADEFTVRDAPTPRPVYNPVDGEEETEIDDEYERSRSVPLWAVLVGIAVVSLIVGAILLLRGKGGNENTGLNAVDSAAIRSNAEKARLDSIQQAKLDSLNNQPPPPTSFKQCPDGNHPHQIDLGLPSGTKWACCNVGANTPEGYGGYYAWGETSEKSDYRYEMYKYWEGEYNDGEEPVFQNIGKSISGTKYDVAFVRSGGSWRMPTLNQIKELLNNCTSKWTTQNGVEGRKFTSKSNGGSIFLPAAGDRWDTDLVNDGSNGYYWSGTQDTEYEYGAYHLYFNSYDADWNNDNRCGGHSVRPVAR